MQGQAAVRAEPQLELKYLLPGSRAAFVLAWLGAVARPDGVHPPAMVVTTYFDTPGLESLDEKIDSDYLKAKVRVRWYAPLDRSPSDSPVFVECKRREGSTRTKRRVAIAARPAQLESLPLSAPEWGALVDGLRGEEPMLSRELAPVLRLAYVRSRFVDHLGVRITLDTDVAVEAVNAARLPDPARLGPLRWAVLEYKGSVLDLPAHLAAITRFDARRSSYSKYLACYQHVTGQIF